MSLSALMLILNCTIWKLYWQAVKWNEEIPNGLKANFDDDFYWCPFQVGNKYDKV